MSGDAEDDGVTTQTQSFIDELKRPDMWRQVTPMGGDVVEGPPSIDAEYEIREAAPSADGDEDDGFTETIEAWQEAEDVLDGDGPFAVPLDGPPRAAPPNPAQDLLADAFAAPPTPARHRPVRPGVPLGRNAPRDLHLGAQPGLEGLERPAAAEPHVLKRKAPPRRPARPSAPEQPPSRPGRTSRRHYPLMLALLKDPSAIQNPARVAPEPPPPVPGTFFPAPREPMEQPEPVDLDKMLLTMAEGLLIGETADGHTEVRVTLKDEFFAGTELRIVVIEGKVQAKLSPPDREVYWQLNASLDDLHQRLKERGLEVESVELLDP